MTVKEFYKVVSTRCRVDIDLYEDDAVYVPIQDMWDAEVLFVKSWCVIQNDKTIGDTHYVMREFTLHFDLEVKR